MDSSLPSSDKRHEDGSKDETISTSSGTCLRTIGCFLLLTVSFCSGDPAAELSQTTPEGTALPVNNTDKQAGQNTPGRQDVSPDSKENGNSSTPLESVDPPEDTNTSGDASLCSDSADLQTSTGGAPSTSPKPDP